MSKYFGRMMGARWQFATIAVYAAGITLGIAPRAMGKATETRLVKQGASFQLLRDGKPYFIKGVGGDGSKVLLKELGGNSFRTWGVEGLEAKLDEAQKLGMTVTAGIWLGHKEHGFNYNDAAQVKTQFENATQAIAKHKDHPALLIWAIGNEMEMGQEDNVAVWRAVEEIAAAAKKIDPLHPTMTVIAEIGGGKVESIHKHCPSIDIIGINTYAGGASVAERYRAAGGQKPYIITEFGPPGQWESAKNSWGAAAELTSTAKADNYRATYQKSIKNQPLSLGSYAFTWGFKQEATATWFGLLLPDGSRLGAVDALAEEWTGAPVKNRAPQIKSVKLNGAERVQPGATVQIALEVADAENDALQVQWLLQGDAVKYGVGGAAEDVPPTYPDAIVKADKSGATFKMPAKGGGYRAFVFVRDNHGGAAVANVPLFVEGGSTANVVVAPAKVDKVEKVALPFTVFDEGVAPVYIPSGYMGNAAAIKMDENWKENPHSGATCIKVLYGAPDNWGGVVWQNPINDWGDLPGGRDLSGAKKLSFRARGEKGGEEVTFQYGLLGKEKKFFDTATGKLDKIKLTTEWRRYEIDLGGADLSRIKTAFTWVVAGQGAPVTFYLDDIKYE